MLHIRKRYDPIADELADLMRNLLPQRPAPIVEGIDYFVMRAIGVLLHFDVKRRAQPLDPSAVSVRASLELGHGEVHDRRISCAIFARFKLTLRPRQLGLVDIIDVDGIGDSPGSYRHGA